MFELLLIPISLLLLYIGGESTLKGVLSIAKKFQLSNILVSAVIIGFGTSLAELTVSIEAVLVGSPDLALGNIVGSNTANILLVTSLAALIAPITIKHLKINRDIFVMGLAAALLLLFKYTDWLNLFTGMIFLLILISYIVFSYYEDQKNSKKNKNETDVKSKLSLFKSILYSVVGISILIFGGWLLVTTSIMIAKNYGISETVIGLTILAVGTSIPELTTTIIASIKKHNDLVIGNILGSNIFNIFGILGITLLIEPIPVTNEMMKKGIWEMIAATLLFILILKFLKKINKIIASIMLILYANYLVYIFY
jgi:cation:H+ antiporter